MPISHLPHIDLHARDEDDSGQLSRPAALVAPDGREIPLTLETFALLEDVLDHLQHGHRVQVVVYEEELTTQQAADVLGVSRQYLVRLIENGAIPFIKVGTHRRMRLRDVLAFQQRRNRERREANRAG